MFILSQIQKNNIYIQAHFLQPLIDSTTQNQFKSKFNILLRYGSKQTPLSFPHVYSHMLDLR